MSPLFELHQAQVNFGALKALKDINLSIEPGESVALVGSNGSGKSTLLRLLHGLLRVSAGTLRTDLRARQAMLFQRPYLMRASVLRNVALGLWLRGVPWARACVKAQEALVRVELADLAQRNARQLSGGQQQRLAMARAWAQSPDVLFLDEPTASLDPHAKREVEQLMADFSTGTGARPMTLIFASHNLGQVKRLARRVVYLEQGRVEADLPVKEFFDAQRLQAVSPAAHFFVQGELI
ncbi:ATP-binding cassette domain-containing protein [Rhodoferax sp. OV413]|uniref:ATP-binding cassette domain-containing protein n=1 Tax=Rhodoferax sp. OV413 TaxID=1855285 RepID=UPI0025D30D27|nr:ATP-binding cassette domain-containing protein [Rhodoferax sp. OV413]